MSQKDIKMIAAESALPYIRDDIIVGLGGGVTISYVIDYLAKKEKIKIKVVTPSEITREWCNQAGVEVLDTSFVTRVDVAFDGCDYVDENFYALKSTGGIHTAEKLIARMADEYILLADESKLEKKLSFSCPVVLECVKEARTYIESQVMKLGGQPSLRQSAAKDGYTISEHGNLLMDVRFERVDDIPQLNENLCHICGVIETSLFTEEVTKIMIASEDGIQVMERNHR